MTVFCIECGAAVDAAAPFCDACGAAQTIDDDAPIAAPAFPTAAVMPAIKPPAAQEPEPEAPLIDDELDLPAPLFPTAAIIAVPPPAAPAPQPAAEEPEVDAPAPPEDELDLPAPTFPTAAIVAVPPPPAPVAPAAAAPPPPPPPISVPAAAYAPAPPPAAEPSQSAPGTHCVNCGNAFPPEGRFCMTCGAPRAGTAEPPPEPSPAAGGQVPPSGGFVPPNTAAPADWQASLPGPFRAVPLDLLIVCALMAVAGLFTLWPVLRVVPDMLDLLTSGDSLGRSLGILLLTVWLVLAFFGVACLLLAWRLANADRVARGLTYVLLGALAAALLFGNVHTTGLTIVLLASLGAIGVLAFAPGPRTFFAGGEQGDHPDGLVIARVLVAVWSVMVGVIGLLFLPLGPLGSKFVIVGLLLLGVAGTAFYLNGRLAQGDPIARIAVSAGVGVYLVLLLILGDRSPGLLLPLALAAGIAGYLWIPKDVQRFFETSGAKQP